MKREKLGGFRGGVIDMGAFDLQNRVWGAIFGLKFALQSIFFSNSINYPNRYLKRLQGKFGAMF